jgi:small subunit ribosomal protein S16
MREGCSSSAFLNENGHIGGNELLAIKLMRTGAKKRPSYRIIVKEKQSKRDGAYLENLGTYNPTRQPAEVNLKLDRVQYWLGKGAQPTETVSHLIKASAKEQASKQVAGV